MMECHTCRAILDTEPRSGAWNMAVDETLLESALAHGICTVRWYRWEEATLSLGYFQKPEEAVDDPRLSELPRVPRLSGGGAILHHHEWTYSCAIPPSHPLAETPQLLYERIHERILAVLAERGVVAGLRGTAGATKSKSEPFLCFARGDARDIVCAGSKILGSAQRRRRGAVLQHGSLLCRRSEYAPEFPGLLDLVPSARWDDAVSAELLECLARSLSDDVRSDDLTPAERERARELQAHPQPRRRPMRNPAV